MKPVHCCKDGELIFRVGDCADALRANPLGHSAERYLAEARAADMELIRRDRLRCARRYARQYGHDRLTVAVRQRRLMPRNYGESLRAAMFQLGWAAKERRHA